MRTRRIAPGDPGHDRALLDLLPEEATTCWLKHEDGLIGWGEAARHDTKGGDRFADLEAWWRDFTAGLIVDDEVRMPGTGPVAFSSLAFADEPGSSSAVVPRVIVGSRNGVRWITTIGDAGEEPVTPVREPGTVRYSDGQLSAAGYRTAVEEAVRRMRTGSDVRKIVLAHDLLATTSEPLDPRFVLGNLAARYPSCWTFAVDGVLGATPELLLRRTGNEVRSRVLAGTSWPHDEVSVDDLAGELLASAKNRSEHAYAVDSLAESLSGFCDEMSVPDEPTVLRLRNVLHLASDVHGKLTGAEPTSLLEMLDAVHPTAAVGGTPTPEAVRMISELEGMDRGRYAGPVGWLDGEGNGEFGIALRCAQVRDSEDGPSQVRLFAGCGIVSDSDPEQEVAEAEAKLLPVREALEGVQ